MAFRPKIREIRKGRRRERKEKEKKKKREREREKFYFQLFWLLFPFVCMFVVSYIKTKKKKK